MVEDWGVIPLQKVTTAGHSPAYRVLITVNLRSARCGQGIGDDTQLYCVKLGRDTKLSSSTNLLIRGITLAMTSASFFCRLVLALKLIPGWSDSAQRFYMSFRRPHPGVCFSFSDFLAPGLPAGYANDR